MFKFHERFNTGILDGTKTITSRLDLKAMTGEIHACVNPHYDPDQYRPFAWVKITKITRMDLGLVDYRREGFDTLEDLMRFLHKECYHVFLTKEIQVYVHEFELTEAPHENA